MMRACDRPHRGPVDSALRDGGFYYVMERSRGLDEETWCDGPGRNAARAIYLFAGGHRCGSGVVWLGHPTSTGQYLSCTRREFDVEKSRFRRS